MIRPYYDNKIYQKGDEVIYFHQVWKSLVDKNNQPPCPPNWISVRIHNRESIFGNERKKC